MTDEFRILFVDDEETFLHSTADLLRREGYACDGVLNVSIARRCLRQERYDLVIADIKMPGNSNLEFVRQLAGLAESASVILVTGHPSVTTAVQSVELPVVAYLIKPFDFQELLAKVQMAARHFKVRRAIRLELSRLQHYRQGLLHMEADLSQQPRTALPQSLQALVGMTMRAISESLANLHGVVELADGRETGVQLPNETAPLADPLREVLRDAVSTLERTKGAFKSKDLGELRRKLELYLKT